MKLFKRLILPVVIFLVVAYLSLFIMPNMSNGQTAMYYLLVADIVTAIYYFGFLFKKGNSSKIYYLYLNVIMLAFFLFSIVATLAMANETISYSFFVLLYFIVVAVFVILIFVISLLYGGLNQSIKNQNKGEDNLAKMKALCEEILFVLGQKGKDTEVAVKEIEMVKEALEYSDPVSHKSVYGIERRIISELKDALNASKHKIIGKVKKVLRDVNEVMHLIEKRNTVLRDHK